MDLCAKKGFSSVAIPVIGPGLLLKYPLSEAVQVLKESICQFALSDQCGNLTTIHIVIKPGYPDSEEVPLQSKVWHLNKCYITFTVDFNYFQSYHEVYKHLSSIMNQRGRGKPDFIGSS